MKMMEDLLMNDRFSNTFAISCFHICNSLIHTFIYHIINIHAREESTQISALGLKVKDLLGQGSFAQVYRCYDYIKNKEYAVKVSVIRCK